MTESDLIDMDMPLDVEPENEGGEDDVEEERGSEPGTTDSDEDDVDDEVPEQKFQVRQKVYARDDKASGVLYE